MDKNRSEVFGQFSYDESLTYEELLDVESTLIADLEALLLLLFVLGALAATRAEKLLGRKDPGEVVIDELVGVWLVLLPFATPGVWLVVAAFVFFRIFDIAKPWPVRASENWLPDGFGVMLDDVLAGLWALLCVGVLHWVGLV